MTEAKDRKVPKYVLRITAGQSEPFDFILYEEEQYTSVLRSNWADWKYRVIKTGLDAASTPR